MRTPLGQMQRTDACANQKLNQCLCVMVSQYIKYGGRGGEGRGITGENLRKCSPHFTPTPFKSLFCFCYFFVFAIAYLLVRQRRMPLLFVCQLSPVHATQQRQLL